MQCAARAHTICVCACVCAAMFHLYDIVYDLFIYERIIIATYMLHLPLGGPLSGLLHHRNPCRQKLFFQCFPCHLPVFLYGKYKQSQRVY